jgi:hypothetical protein
MNKGNKGQPQANNLLFAVWVFNRIDRETIRFICNELTTIKNSRTRERIKPHLRLHDNYWTDKLLYFILAKSLHEHSLLKSFRNLKEKACSMIPPCTLAMMLMPIQSPNTTMYGFYQRAEQRFMDLRADKEKKNKKGGINRDELIRETLDSFRLVPTPLPESRPTC